MDQARGDLDHARHDMDAGFYEWACFSAQQAAEKAVKAVFQGMGAEAWGHSVADLLDELSQTNASASRLRDAALDLDRAYILDTLPKRTSSEAPRRPYTRGEAEQLVNHAEQIITFCEGLLPSA